MKILLAGDIHGNTSQARYLMDTAVEKECDLVFALGDFGAWEHFPRGVKYFDDVSSYARQLGIPVYWLDGNHDKTSLVMEKYGDNRTPEGFVICRPSLYYAPRGHRWEWDGATFIALGGAYSIDKDYRLAVEQHEGSPPGTQWFPEEEMTDAEMDTILLDDSSPVKVMLTHDKPRSSQPGWNRKDLPECWPNQDRIQKAVEQLHPKLLAHGHLHYPYEDIITHEGHETAVIGLEADPWAAGSFYRVEHSWAVLDTIHLKAQSPWEEYR